MKIGEVAEQPDIPTSTIRFYENVGLIRAQPRVSGTRVFDARAVFALRFVQLAQAAGFSLAEMKLLLERQADNVDPAEMWQLLAHAKRYPPQPRLATFHCLVQRIPVRDINQCAATVKTRQGR